MAATGAQSHKRGATWGQMVNTSDTIIDLDEHRNIKEDKSRTSDWRTKADQATLPQPQSTAFSGSTSRTQRNTALRNKHRQREAEQQSNKEPVAMTSGEQAPKVAEEDIAPAAAPLSPRLGGQSSQLDRNKARRQRYREPVAMTSDELAAAGQWAKNAASGEQAPKVAEEGNAPAAVPLSPRLGGQSSQLDRNKARRQKYREDELAAGAKNAANGEHAPKVAEEGTVPAAETPDAFHTGPSSLLQRNKERRARQRQKDRLVPSEEPVAMTSDELAAAGQSAKNAANGEQAPTQGTAPAASPDGGASLVNVYESSQTAAAAPLSQHENKRQYTPPRAAPVAAAPMTPAPIVPAPAPKAASAVAPGAWPPLAAAPALVAPHNKPAAHYGIQTIPQSYEPHYRVPMVSELPSDSMSLIKHGIHPDTPLEHLDQIWSQLQLIQQQRAADDRSPPARAHVPTAEWGPQTDHYLVPG